jgi:hypothetical protein
MQKVNYWFWIATIGLCLWTPSAHAGSWDDLFWMLATMLMLTAAAALIGSGLLFTEIRNKAKGKEFTWKFYVGLTLLLVVAVPFLRGCAS